MGHEVAARLASREQALGRSEDAHGPHDQPAAVEDRRRARNLTGVELTDVGGSAALAHACQLALQALGVGDRGVRERLEPCLGDLGGRVGMVGEQDLAERGRVGG
jgi:hypothetical protein